MFSPKSVKKIKVAEGPVTTANITKSRLRPRKMISALKKISFKSDKENFVERVIEDIEDREEEDFVPQVNHAVDDEASFEGDSEWTREENARIAGEVVELVDDEVLVKASPPTPTPREETEKKK